MNTIHQPQLGGADKIRPSPSQSATLYKVGTKKTGNDGNKWIVTETANGTKRWKLHAKPTKTTKTTRTRSKSKSRTRSKSKKAKTRGSYQEEINQKFNNLGNTTKTYIKKSELSSKNKEYIIHDNGGRPFKVICNNKGISVSTYTKPEDDDYENLVYDVPLLKFTPSSFLGYWSGFDTSSWTNFHGNTLLIQETLHKYVFIGQEIFRFETEEEITDYVSPVGNSDVPYPIAYGCKNVYFMLDKEFIAKDQLKTPPVPINAEDMYGEFYGHLYPDNNKSLKKIKFKHVKILQKRLW